MAWGAAATGTPAATGSTGQGLSLMQESLAEITLARLPLVVLNMARAQGDYYQATRGGGHGDYRHLVLAPVDVAEAVAAGRHGLRPGRAWRNPVLVMGDYYLAHTARSVTIPEPVRTRPVPEWALDGSSGGIGRAKLVSFLGTAKQRDDVGYDLADHYAACAAAHRRAWSRRSSRWPRSTGLRRRRGGRGGLRHAGHATCGPPSAELRAEGRRSGTCGRSRCSRSRPRRWPRRPSGPGRSPSTRTTRAR